MIGVGVLHGVGQPPMLSNDIDNYSPDIANNNNYFLDIACISINTNI